MRINHNVPAINSIRVLQNRQNEINKGIASLSSGLRINNAGDDSAGFAVSEKLRTHIDGLSAAARNTDDGLSFIQTTEGYLSESQNLLRRIKSLAIQAGNGIYSSDDRSLIQQEVGQLVAEIDRLTSFATFNGQRILDGRFAAGGAEGVPIASLFFHVGTEVDQTIRAYIGTFSAEALGLQGISLSTPQGANQTIAILDEALSKVNTQRTTLGAYENRLTSVLKTSNRAIENLTEAESKIRDVDVSAAYSELVKNILVSQANIAVLAQANSNAQSVLRLLS